MNPIEELYALQETTGYLSEEDLRALSKKLGVPLYELEGISSFYPHFRRTPPPTYRVGACRDLACHLRDGGRALAKLERSSAGTGLLRSSARSREMVPSASRAFASTP